MTTEGNTEEEGLPMEIGVDEANERRAGGDLWFLDVREDPEFRTCHLHPDGFIPMGELGEKWPEVPADKEVVVYCHHGMRSLTATKFLRSHGIVRARSLRGGIEQWSRTIDPTVPRY